jgi:hypothetical protein
MLVTIMTGSALKAGEKIGEYPSNFGEAAELATEPMNACQYSSNKSPHIKR